MNNVSATDVIVISSGHNGLVCAADLARAGLRVQVREARSVIGVRCTSTRSTLCAPSPVSPITACQPKGSISVVRVPIPEVV